VSRAAPRVVSKKPARVRRRKRKSTKSMPANCKLAKKDALLSLSHRQEMKKERPIAATAVRAMPATIVRSSFIFTFVERRIQREPHLEW
jgi:hypothetical protein